MGRFWIALISILVTACDVGGADLAGAGSGPIDIPDQAIGGAWIGTDSVGSQVLALVTEDGRLHWISQSTGEQGFGTITVAAITTTIDFMYVPPLQFTLSDGSASAVCTGGGSVGERDFLNATVTCSTSLGGSYENSVMFAYDTLYDRDSSLALIAGNYDDQGLVVNVAADGQVFEQDPVSGCVVIGEIGIIDSQYNAYQVSITYSSCTGGKSILNGATFTGLGILDNTAVPEAITIGLTGAVGGTTHSIIYALPRL